VDLSIGKKGQEIESSAAPEARATPKGRLASLGEHYVQEIVLQSQYRVFSRRSNIFFEEGPVLLARGKISITASTSGRATDWPTMCRRTSLWKAST
jgi:hypothetical protein